VEAVLRLHSIRQAFTTQIFNVTGTMTGVLVLMVVVLLVNWLLDRAEAHLLRWRPAGPDTSTTQG
jgi:ABC-type nitrate/sulfonate/bicarbonate transport system permease component